MSTTSRPPHPPARCDGRMVVAVALTSTACASLGRKEKGAVIGAAAGAAVGGVIGYDTGSTARGAIIGAVIGGAAGAIIGHQMDQQAKELKLAIPAQPLSESEKASRSRSLQACCTTSIPTRFVRKQPRT